MADQEEKDQAQEPEVVDTSRTVSPEPPHSAEFPQEESDLVADVPEEDESSEEE